MQSDAQLNQKIKQKGRNIDYRQTGSGRLTESTSESGARHKESKYNARKFEG